jgi:hypothetical protein
MQNDVATALSRINRALARSEQALSAARIGGASAPNSESDARYLAMRSRTQAALAELDTVIARVAKAGQG